MAENYPDLLKVQSSIDFKSVSIIWDDDDAHNEIHEMTDIAFFCGFMSKHKPKKIVFLGKDDGKIHTLTVKWRKILRFIDWEYAYISYKRIRFYMEVKKSYDGVKVHLMAEDPIIENKIGSEIFSQESEGKPCFNGLIRKRPRKD